MVGGLRAHAPQREFGVKLPDDASLHCLVERLREQGGPPIYEWLGEPGTTDAPKRVLLLVNGHFVFPSGDPEAILKDGDVVSVMPVISGGQPGPWSDIAMAWG
jgi:sulfur carrier protein ThiS